MPHLYQILVWGAWLPVVVFFSWDWLSRIRSRFSTKYDTDWQQYGWGTEWNEETQSYASNPYGVRDKKNPTEGLDSNESSG